MSEYVSPRKYGEYVAKSEPRFPLGVFWGTASVAILWFFIVTVDAMPNVGLEMLPWVIGTFLRNPLWFPIGALLGFFVVTVIVVTVVWVVTAALTAPVGLLVASLLRTVDDSLLDPKAPARGTLYLVTGFGTGVGLTLIALRYTIPISEFVGGDGAIGLGGMVGGFFGAWFGWMLGITLGTSYGAAQVVDEWEYWKPWIVLELGFDSRLLPLSDEKIERFREEAAVHQSGENNTHQQSPMDDQEKRSRMESLDSLPRGD